MRSPLIRRLALAAGLAALSAAAPLAWGQVAPAPSASAPGVASVAPAPTAAQGRSLYTSFCTRCHGVNMINTAGTTYDLRVFPKDQRERFERSVVQGLRAMPAWGTTLTPEELQALWLYVSAVR